MTEAEMIHMRKIAGHNWTEYTTNAPFNKKMALFTSTLDLELRKKLVKCYISSMVLKLGRFGQ